MTLGPLRPQRGDAVEVSFSVTTLPLPDGTLDFSERDAIASYVEGSTMLGAACVLAGPTRSGEARDSYTATFAPGVGWAAMVEKAVTAGIADAGTLPAADVNLGYAAWKSGLSGVGGWGYAVFAVEGARVVEGADADPSLVERAGDAAGRTLAAALKPLLWPVLAAVVVVVVVLAATKSSASYGGAKLGGR